MTTPPVSWEDRLMTAVVAQFFAPQWQQTTLFNPATGQNEMSMVQTMAPAARVAHDIFSSRHGEILAAVKERVDMDELAEKVWERVRDDLMEKLTATGWLSVHEPERKVMRDRMNELIAQELARRTLEKMDQDAQAEATP